MRRVLFTAVASVAILAAGTTTALARHHHRSHARHDRIRHDRGVETIMPPAAPGAQTVGQVVSFTPAVAGGSTGVLMIKLTNGPTISAQVTDSTRLECQAANSTTTMQTNDHGQGGGDNRGGGHGHGGDNGTGAEGNDPGDDGNGDQRDPGEMQQNCTTAALAPGAVIDRAELRSSSVGSVWEEIALVA